MERGTISAFLQGALRSAEICRAKSHIARHSPTHSHPHQNLASPQGSYRTRKREVALEKGETLAQSPAALKGAGLSAKKRSTPPAGRFKPRAPHRAATQCSDHQAKIAQVVHGQFKDSKGLKAKIHGGARELHTLI